MYLQSKRATIGSNGKKIPDSNIQTKMENIKKTLINKVRPQLLVIQKLLAIVREKINDRIVNVASQISAFEITTANRAKFTAKKGYKSFKSKVQQIKKSPTQ
jgi:CO dehydrogenase/acetyl-CoA synthase epsilon subunit